MSPHLCHLEDSEEYLYEPFRGDTMSDLDLRLRRLEAQMEVLLAQASGRAAQDATATTPERTLTPSTFSARVKYAPPLSDTEMREAFAFLPLGRFISSTQFADSLKHVDLAHRYATARRYLYWLAQKGLIKWDDAKKSYNIPIQVPF